jgi:hypothetical protein
MRIISANGWDIVKDLLDKFSASIPADGWFCFEEHFSQNKKSDELCAYDPSD